MARKNRHMQRTIFLILIVVAVLLWQQYQSPDNQVQPPEGGESVLTVERAVAGKMTEVMLTASGKVIAVLDDDREGSRHQRFIMEVPSGCTLLVAHNIDLAPRVPVNVLDKVTIHGQYEWNARGGVLHWTHHDPAGQHEGGWIDHKDQRYE